MSTKPAEEALSVEEISVDKQIPLTQLIYNAQYDIYINLETALQKKLAELFQSRITLTSSQSQNTPMNTKKKDILAIYDKIYQQFQIQFEDIMQTKDNIEIQKTHFLMTMGVGDIPAAREEENQKTRKAILMANKDSVDYASKDYHNRIWKEQMLAIIKKTLSDLKHIKLAVEGDQPNFFVQDAFSKFNLYNMNETTEVFFLMYYAQEWLLKILYTMFKYGTTNYRQDPNQHIFTLPSHEFLIFIDDLNNKRLLPQIITDFESLVGASGGGKKIKSKSNFHSRRTKIKTKKQSKQKKSNKTKKSRK
jgi:hypothetical protein